MNTIADNRGNPHKGRDVARIIDDAARRMREHSPGCELIDGLMADCWDGYDPWGSNFDAWFQLEYACQFHGWPNHPSFSSPYTTGDPDEGMLYVDFVEAMTHGRITPDDAEFARSVLDELDEAFRARDLSY